MSTNRIFIRPKRGVLSLPEASVHLCVSLCLGRQDFLCRLVFCNYKDPVLFTADMFPKIGDMPDMIDTPTEIW